MGRRSQAALPCGSCPSLNGRGSRFSFETALPLQREPSMNTQANLRVGLFRLISSTRQVGGSGQIQYPFGERLSRVTRSNAAADVAGCFSRCNRIGNACPERIPGVEKGFPSLALVMGRLYSSPSSKFREGRSSYFLSFILRYAKLPSLLPTAKTSTTISVSITWYARRYPIALSLIL